MYNRYIPQSDGSYKRNCIPDRISPKQPPQQSPVYPEPTPPPPPLPRQVPCQPEIPCDVHPPQPKCNKQNSIPDFFRQLLPQNIDTADLLIIVLLLLMCADREEDKTNALLTLALYFFM